MKFTTKDELNYNLQSRQAGLNVKPLTGWDKFMADAIGFDERGQTTKWGEFVKAVFAIDPIGLGAFQFGHEAHKEDILARKNDDVSDAMKKSDYDDFRKHRLVGSTTAARGGLEVASNVMSYSGAGQGGGDGGPTMTPEEQALAAEMGVDGISMAPDAAPYTGDGMIDGNRISIDGEFTGSPDFAISSDRAYQDLTGDINSRVEEMNADVIAQDRKSKTTDVLEGMASDFLNVDEDMDAGQKTTRIIDTIFGNTGGNVSDLNRDVQRSITEASKSGNYADAQYAKDLQDNSFTTDSDLAWAQQIPMGIGTYFQGVQMQHEANRAMDSSLRHYLNSLDRQLDLAEYEFAG